MRWWAVSRLGHPHESCHWPRDHRLQEPRAEQAAEGDSIRQGERRPVHRQTQAARPYHVRPTRRRHRALRGRCPSPAAHGDQICAPTLKTSRLCGAPSNPFRWLRLFARGELESHFRDGAHAEGVRDRRPMPRLRLRRQHYPLRRGRRTRRQAAGRGDHGFPAVAMVAAAPSEPPRKRTRDDSCRLA